MKPRSLFTLRQATRATAAGFLLASSALPAAAETLYWNGINDGTTSWANILNWSQNSSATTPNPATGEWPKADDNVVFNISTLTTDQVIHLNNSNQAVNSLTFSSAGNTTIIRSGGATSNVFRTITLGAGGLTVNSGAGNVTTGIGAGTGNQFVNIGLIGNNFFKNDSSSALTIGRQVTTANDLGAITLTVNGSGSGLTDFQREIFQGATSADAATSGTTLSVQISTASDHTTLFRNAGSTFSGGLVINSGLVGARTSNGFGAGTITINGGAIGATGSSRSYNNGLVIGGNVQFGGINNEAGAGSAAATWNGNVDLGNATRTITLGGSSQTFAGIISNGGLILESNGSAQNLTFSGSNSYAGSTKVGTDVTLALNNNLALQNSALDTSGAGFVTLGAGITTPTLGGLTGSNALAGVITTGYSSVTNLTLNPGVGVAAEYNAAIANGAADMTLTKSGEGIQAFRIASSYSGGTILNAGGIAIRNSSSPLGSGKLTINGGAIGSVVSARSLANNIDVNADFRIGGVNYTGASNADTTFNGSVNLGGTVRTVTLASSATFSNEISNGGLDVVSSGSARTLNLGGANSYSGATSVGTNVTLAITDTGSINSTSGISVAAGGTFRYNSSTALIVSPTLNGTGTGSGQRAVLSGTGPINSAVALDNPGDVISPGNSPGIQTYTVGQSWSSFSYDWELNNFIDTTAGTDFDQIGITGTLALNGGSDSYILNVLGLTEGNAAGLVLNFSEINRSWTILTSAGITGFNAAYWTINTAGFTNPDTGNWSLDQVGNNLVLSYAPVPEPRAALLGSLSMLMLLRRRRA